MQQGVPRRTESPRQQLVVVGADAAAGCVTDRVIAAVGRRSRCGSGSHGGLSFHGSGLRGGRSRAGPFVNFQKKNNHNANILGAGLFRPILVYLQSVSNFIRLKKKNCEADCIYS
jgi:hypothetical protein